MRDGIHSTFLVEVGAPEEGQDSGAVRVDTAESAGVTLDRGGREAGQVRDWELAGRLTE